MALLMLLLMGLKLSKGSLLLMALLMGLKLSKGSLLLMALLMLLLMGLKLGNRMDRFLSAAPRLSNGIRNWHLKC
jgi:hypothetical protein